MSLTINSNMRPLPDLVRQRGIGAVIDEDCDDAALRRRVRTMLAERERNVADRRDRCLNACRELYLWRRHLPIIREAYGY